MNAPSDQPPLNTTFAIRADLLDFTADPGFGAPAEAPGVRYRPDHWLLVKDGSIVGAQDLDPGEGWERHDHRGALLTPGFIDTHVHSPQLDIIGSYGAELLDWLRTYTFPAESRYADPDVATAGASQFLDALCAHGTTAAAVFPTVHAVSADALFMAAKRRGMRLIAGKVMMDRNAPAVLLDTVESAERESSALIERWHGQDRLAYALTVRFAPTSSDAQLAMAGRLLAATPGAYLQTHIAENKDEVAWVASLFPSARSYLDVYERHGLLGPTTVLAHGIWLDDADRSRLAASGASIAHSPSSNLFLGSGLMDFPGLEAAGVRVSVATDVGAGTSLSMLRTLADAYRVQAMRGVRLSAWKALHAATRGAAESLGLAAELGTLDVGATADLTLWRWAVGTLAEQRQARANDLHEKVFAWMIQGDERNLLTTWVAGRRVYEASSSPQQPC